jgi:hypothetical protein
VLSDRALAIEGPPDAPPSESNATNGRYFVTVHPASRTIANAYLRYVEGDEVTHPERDNDVREN